MLIYTWLLNTVGDLAASFGPRIATRMRLIVSIFAAFLVAIPSIASAQLWADGGTAQCGDLNESALGISQPDAQPQQPDCSSVSDDDVDDPSYNFCFADAGDPVSALPELIAQKQAEAISAKILEVAQERHEVIVLSQPETKQTEKAVIVKRVRTAECSSIDITCERQPYSPSALTLQSLAAPPILPMLQLDVDANPLADVAQRHTPNPGLAPADGIKNVLVPPPDMA